MNSTFLIIVFWIFIIHFASWGIGWTIIRRIGLNRPQHLSEAIACPVILGHWILGVSILLLGIFKLLYLWLIGIFLIIAFIGSLVVFLRYASYLASLYKRIDPLFMLAFIFLCLWLLRSFIPFFNVDALNYHIALPKIYLDNHSIVGNPYSLYANMPHNIELLCVAPLLVGDPLSVKIFVFSFHFLVLLLLSAFSKKFLPQPVSGILAILYVSAPIVQIHFERTNFEPVLACFMLFALISLLEWRRNNLSSQLFISCGIAGYLMGCKYTTWYLCAAILILTIAAVFIQIKNHQNKISLLTLFFTVWAISIVPWLIKNWIVTGNPVYPTLYSAFGGTAWSSFDLKIWLYLYDSKRGSGLWYYLTPILSLFDFTNRPVWSYTLTIYFIISLLIPNSWRKDNKYVLAVALTSILAFSLSPACQSRFILTFFPVLLVSAGLSISVLLKNKWIQLAVLFPICYLVFQFQLPTIDHNLLRSKEEYQKYLMNNSSIQLWNFLDQKLPPDAIVYALFDINTLYYNRDFIKRDSYILRNAGNIDKAEKQLKSLGVTHLLVDWRRADIYFKKTLSAANEGYVEKKLVAAERKIFDDFIAQKTSLISLIHLKNNRGKITVHKLNG